MNVPTTSAADEEKIATAEAIIAKAEAAAPEDPAFKTCMDKPPASIRYPVCDTKTGLWIQPEDAAKEVKKAAIRKVKALKKAVEQKKRRVREADNKKLKETKKKLVAEKREADKEKAVKKQAVKKEKKIKAKELK